MLFVMYHHRYVRQFESMIRLLAERGHHVHIAFQVMDEHVTAKRSAKLAARLAQEHETVTVGRAARRDDAWVALVSALRRSIDYLRYLSPLYAKAPKLRARREWQAPDLVVGITRLPLLRGPRGIALLSRLLHRIDRAVPESASIIEFIRERRPDLVLVTPLVSEPTQEDYVRAAAAMGLRSGLCVASWDNLTNKGLIRALPDRVYVWNGDQLKEAVELHRVPRESVVVSGAHTFDQWFGRRPSTRPAEFRERCGLPADRPFLLYLCSSRFVAKREPPFVARWIRELRSCGDPRLADAGVLVRPHPKSGHSWRKSELDSESGVTVWPPTGASTTSAQAKADYFDSMYHCMGVVGLNTSGLIESAIVRRPVFTVLLPEFEWGQEGTLHFHYLKSENGGPLIAARTFDEHFEQMSATLRNWREDERDGFLTRFVRPRGLEQPATPILVEAVEEQLAAAPQPVRVQPARPGLVVAIRPLAALATWARRNQQRLERLAAIVKEARRWRRRRRRQGRRALRAARKRMRRTRRRLVAGLGRAASAPAPGSRRDTRGDGVDHARVEPPAGAADGRPPASERAGVGSER
ncbi:MAG: hypothetical protein ACJ76S_12405 [Solirubrobacteraceae bacterium]